MDVLQKRNLEITVLQSGLYALNTQESLSRERSGVYIPTYIPLEFPRQVDPMRNPQSLSLNQ
jgi:hypothetical protein